MRISGIKATSRNVGAQQGMKASAGEAVLSVTGAVVDVENVRLEQNILYSTRQ